MSLDIAIKVENLSKCYHIYETPRDRLKQFTLPRFHKMIGREPCRYYREFWALKSVSLEVKRGETVGIIGRNGSGKSTLLQLICGTLNPTSGTIQTNGRVAALLELGAGFNPDFTGRENVYMNAAVLGLGKEEIDARFDDIAGFADIGDFIEQPVKTYSSGMLVRLAFAVAINVQPEILVVDEALSVGDELFQRKCFSRIESIRANGATILFVSHSGAQVVELCDRAILLDAGEKLAVGQPKSMVGKYQKLIYAPEDKRSAIRNEIRTSDNDNVAAHELSRTIQERLCFSQDPKRTDADELDGYFDSNLKPQSSLEYESHGAYINSPQILTLSGHPVNCLKRRKIYRYTYQVRFDSDASNVRFGMLIKTTSGLELGGAVSAPTPEKGLLNVAAGSVIKVEYRFICSLNVGTYFLNAGVAGTVNNADTYLHRVLDLCMFKVMPSSDDVVSGIIDFACEPELTILKN